MANCIICGCDEHHACYDMDHGPCWWIHPTIPVCSHCSTPKLIKSASRYRDPKEYAPEMSKPLLKKYLQALGIKVSITSPSKRHAQRDYWVVNFLSGKEELFESLIPVLFDKSEKCSPGTFSFNPKDIFNN